MSVIDELASATGSRDDVPNQRLAKKLVDALSSRSVQGDIRLLVTNLGNPSKAIRSDCIKVLYEIGYLKTELIANHVDEFAALLRHKDNRLVWGGMIALGTMASHQARAIWPHRQAILDSVKHGSVITKDWGIRVLAALAAADPGYAAVLTPFLMDFLRNCRPKDVAGYAESIAVAAVDEAARAGLRGTLTTRLGDLQPAALKRVERLIKRLG